MLSAVLASQPASGEDLPTVAVMEFASKGGIAKERVDALSDLLATEIRKIGRHKVISSEDILSLLKVEEHKVLAGCTDDSCLAEIGGALGAGLIVVGNIGRFGDAYLLNLKLLDVANVKAVSRLSKKIKGGEEDLIDALSMAGRELFGLSGSAVDVYEKAAPTAYSTWGHVSFWSGAGLAAFGGLALWQAQVAADDYGRDGSSAAADRNDLWNGLGGAGFALGGALLATGVILWLLDPDEGPAVSVSVDGSGPGLMVLGRW